MIIPTKVYIRIWGLYVYDVEKLLVCLPTLMSLS